MHKEEKTEAKEVVVLDSGIGEAKNGSSTAGCCAVSVMPFKSTE